MSRLPVSSPDPSTCNPTYHYLCDCKWRIGADAAYRCSLGHKLWFPWACGSSRTTWPSQKKPQSQFVNDIDVHTLHRFGLNMAANHLLLRAHLRLCTVLPSSKGDRNVVNKVYTYMLYTYIISRTRENRSPGRTRPGTTRSLGAEYPGPEGVHLLNYGRIIWRLKVTYSATKAGRTWPCPEGMWDRVLLSKHKTVRMKPCGRTPNPKPCSAWSGRSAQNKLLAFCHTCCKPCKEVRQLV